MANQRKMRFLLRACALFCILLFTLVAGTYIYLRQSLPQTRGELRLGGLHSPVEVLRDRNGVPHIYAASVADAYFALGFVHAQDRLWQMEVSRRIAAGRLAEILGPAALNADRLFRTLGIHSVARANLKHYGAGSRRLLEAYSAGVNAFIDSRPVLPPEFWIFRVAPEPWTPADSIAWVKVMAWDLGGNWRNELLRLELSTRLPVALIQEFLPPYPGDAPLPLPDLGKLYGALGEAPAQVAAETSRGPDPQGLGSNSWVVAGSRTASGKPLLANDPHLGLTAPSVWYLAHLHAPGLQVIGATLPGVPGVLVGRTDRIAWGFTNTGPDVQDLYLERLERSGGYLTPQGPRAFDTRRETIKVKGAEDEHLIVRLSRHGPVISDVVQRALDAAPRGYALALAWTALAEDDLTLQAALRFSQVRDWPSFVAVGRDLAAPQQNVTYADVDGNIGFIAPGRVPIRKPENDLHGLAPAPGWDARYDWAGFVPYDELPRSFNPREGAIVTANQKIVPPGYRYFITSEWEAPYRAERIGQLLRQTARHDLPGFARMQADTVSLAMRDLLPFFRNATLRSPLAKEVIAKLAAWDGNMAADRAEPLIAVAWWRELARAVYADELGAAFRHAFGPRAPFLTRALAEGSEWCDDIRTRARESCSELLSESLEKALTGLRRRYGDDPARWKWGEAHVAESVHRPLSRSRLLARFFDIEVPTPGDTYTVNVGAMDFSDPSNPFASRHAASLRALYDLADPQASLFIQSSGQSGNVLSPHYRDFARPWARGEYVPMLTERARIEASGAERLVLEPR
jgi:penicillin amidase